MHDVTVRLSGNWCNSSEQDSYMQTLHKTQQCYL